MDYDGEGNVVALNALNDDGKTVLAGYTGYEGKPCTAVIGDLVGQINAGGYFDTTIDGHETKHRAQDGAGLRLSQRSVPERTGPGGPGWW